MTTKIEWKNILEDFKNRHPKLGKEVIYWKPSNYAEIIIELKNGQKLIYNYDDKIAKFLREDGR